MKEILKVTDLYQVTKYKSVYTLSYFDECKTHESYDINKKITQSRVTKNFDFIKKIFIRGLLDMLEKLLKDLLQLETREDFREFNKGNIIALDLNNRCDLAYIRSKFKRSIKGYEGLILTDSNNNNVRLDFENSYCSLEGRDKIMKSIQNWIDNCIAAGCMPNKLSFY